MRGQREQLAVGGDKTAMRQGEQDAARGGARQIGGTREVAQRRRTGDGAEHLQQAKPAIQRLDEVGGALVLVGPLQLGHDLNGSKIGLAVGTRHGIIRTFVQ